MLPAKPVSLTENAVSESSTTSVDTADTVAEAVDQAIASLEADDFHSQWERSKQISQQLTQWGDRAVPHLLDHLKTATEPDIQWFLVRLLSQFDQIEVIEAIAQLLATTQNEDLQIEARKALTRIGSSAIEPVSGLLSQDNPIERRILAARVLAYIRRTATIEPLLSIAKDDSPEIRAIATEALGSFHDPRITPILLAALEADVTEAEAAETSVAICIEAIRTLGRRSDLLPHTDLVEPLQRCLLREHRQIAKESAIALGRLSTQDAAIALGKALLQPIATEVKSAIVRALGWIDSAAAVQSLAIAFNQSAPLIMPALKPEIARALGQTRSLALKPQAAEPLTVWLRAATEPLSPDSSAEPALKQAVVSALARLGETTAIAALIPLLADPDSRIKMHVLSALHQIDSEAAKAQLCDYLTNQNHPAKLRDEVKESLKAWSV